MALLHNPNAGRGKGAAVAARFRDTLPRAGHVFRTIDVTQPGTVDGSAGDLIEWAEAVVIVGGDGTLHRTLPMLVQHRRPIYHAAVGTENLFALAFGHGRSPERFLRAAASHAIRSIDIATLSSSGSTSDAAPFAIMASLGPDASVVHRLSARRSGPISHLSYLRPTLVELISPRIPTLTVRVDGRGLVSRTPGMVLIANMRQYAVGLNPASLADPTDGLLDVVFFRGTSILPIAFGILARRLGAKGVGRWARGSRVEIELAAADQCLPQADGEAIDTRQARLLTAQVVPNAIDVFVVR